MSDESSRIISGNIWVRRECKHRGPRPPKTAYIREGEIFSVISIATQTTTAAAIIATSRHEVVVECDDVQEVVEKLVRKADTITGDPTVSKTYQHLLQNVVLEDLKKHLLREDALAREGHSSALGFLYKEHETRPSVPPMLGVDESRDRIQQKSLFVKFESKAKIDTEYAVLGVQLPGLPTADQPEYRSANDPQLYRLEELVLSLRDGKMNVTMGSRGHTTSPKLGFPVPVFVDPAFDPDNLYDFVIAALRRMRALQEECLIRYDEIDRLNGEISVEKNGARQRFETLWKKAWS
jgi:hypothetical protein